MAIQQIDYSGSIQNWDDATADYVSRIAIAPRSTIDTYDRLHQTNFAANWGINATEEQRAAASAQPVTLPIAVAPDPPAVMPAPVIQVQPILSAAGSTSTSGSQSNSDSSRSTTMPVQTVDFSGSTAGWADGDAQYVSRNALAPVSTIRTYDIAHKTQFADQWGFDATPEQRAAATVAAPAGGAGLADILPWAIGAALVYAFWKD